MVLLVRLWGLCADEFVAATARGEGVADSYVRFFFYRRVGKGQEGVLMITMSVIIMTV